MNPPYHFSDLKELFAYNIYELTSPSMSQSAIYISLSSRQNGINKLKMLDWWPLDDTAVSEWVFWSFMLESSQRGVDFITQIPGEMKFLLDDLFLSKVCFIKRQREYLYWPREKESVLRKLKGNVEFYLCDGDVAFVSGG